MTFYPVFPTWGKETGDDEDESDCDDDGDDNDNKEMMVMMMYAGAKERVVLER